MDQQSHRYETFGAVLRRIRQSKKLTQRDVARRLKVDFAYVSRLETARLTGLPKRETIEKIAKAMKCTAMETAELLAAAGRVSEEMQTRPELRRLFRTVFTSALKSFRLNHSSVLQTRLHALTVLVLVSPRKRPICT